MTKDLMKLVNTSKQIFVLISNPYIHLKNTSMLMPKAYYLFSLQLQLCLGGWASHNFKLLSSFQGPRLETTGREYETEN